MSLAAKPGYQETIVGWIPPDWTPSQLSAIADINPSRTKPESESADVSFLAMGDVSEDGQILDRQVRRYQDVAKGFTSFIDNDVLVAKISPCFENGKGALATQLLGGTGFGSTEFHVIRPKEGISLPSFLYLHTRSDSFRRLGEKNMVGSAGQKRVPAEFLRHYPIALPPLLEQQKIAAILTTVDDILDVTTRLITATQTLKQGLMQTLFSRGVGTQDAAGRWIPHCQFKESELGPIPVAWAIRNLESVANVERGKFSARPRNDPKYFEAGDIPFIQTGDVACAARFVERASQFLNTEGLGVSKLFPVGTIFITIAANIGDVAIAKVPMACPDSVVGITANGDICDSVWLYYLLNTSKDYFVSRATQNAQKNINLQVLKPFQFALPPLPEQRRIADILTTSDDKLDVLSYKKAHYQGLKRGLMRKLLTGEWRVKLESAPATA